MDKGLVSIIMLSHGDGRYVEESVRSVLAQTYQNWELLFVGDQNSEAISRILKLRDEELARLISERRLLPGARAEQTRIKVSFITNEGNVTPRRNSALRDARGRWIAFLDTGDIWKPEKLERQVAFMAENGYAFSYTKYGLIGSKMSDGRWLTFDRGIEVGGKSVVTYKDMLKCCWPAYMTVMYDASRIETVQIKKLERNNDYALWLRICYRHDCHLLDENLASMRTPWGVMGRLLATNKIKWRYEVYRVEEDMNPFQAALYTIRNMCYGVLKWMKYVTIFDL